MFDTSSGKSISKAIEACSKYEMKALVLSHPHFDHAENASVISERFNIPVAYHSADDEIFDHYDAQPLKSYGLVGFVVLKMSVKVLREIKVDRPKNHYYIKEGDTLADYGFPEIRVVELPGHLYYDLDVKKKTAKRIRSFGYRKIYYGYGKPTDKF